MHISLLAEGPGEVVASRSEPIAPRHPIPAERWGPAHHLVARCLELDRGVAGKDLVFVEPLRVRGLVARGSALLHKTTLRRLLTWPVQPPDLHVALVDEDGETGRAAMLRAHVAGLLVPALVIGVAVREFEAWLIADEAALRRAVGRHAPTSKPESLPPREAKGFLTGAISASPRREDEFEVRRELARSCDMHVVAQRCRSFQRFRGELRDPSPVSGG